MHLFLVANIVTTSKALVTSSDALVTNDNYGCQLLHVGCFTFNLATDPNGLELGGSHHLALEVLG